ncbi:MAG: hypothetical protein HC837_14020 [Chloroflexaceae bacterium]|nr:hypothetical protein [Chloroflexaceae bacterium]
MSSFILLPMTMVVSFQAFQIISQRWDMLWIILAGLIVTALFLVRIGLITFNREEILSREHQRGVDIAFLRLLRQPSAANQPLEVGSVRVPRFAPLSKRLLRGPIGTIVQRELSETLTDWRVLLPIFILTFVVPVGLVIGTGFAIDFIGDPRSISELVPFAILLVGFIPGSFSLITALESFVGERERNSLEALLSMPLVDRQLYIGKLISALATPLLTSFSAMLSFALLMAVFYPNLFFDGMTYPWSLTRPSHRYACSV